MKNFDSVPQLSYVHHCAARSRHGSHSRQCRHSLLQRQLVALLQCWLAGHDFGGLVQQLQDQSPEPLVATVEGFLTEQLIESNWIESTRLWHWIKSFYFLPNRPSLLSEHLLTARRVWELACIGLVYKCTSYWLIDCELWAVFYQLQKSSRTFVLYC